MVPPPTSGSLVDDIVDNAQTAPHRIALSVNRGGAWVGVTSQQFLDQVKAVAKGIIASGVEPGQRVGIMSRTRYDWTVADYAIWYAGGTVVPIYETSSAEQVEWILGDSNAVGVFLESAKNKKVFDEVADRLPD
ncbi:MAG: long-chain fatty acid--CoA ligase, partial [Actinobacteria bacterium]|nr:long-chain fatty acid--CoA ligase [Actinomycetota bacterium]